MQDIRRNLLYEVKKQSSKRSDPFYNPNSQDDDIRAENQRLRTRIRAQDTQIIRLNSKIEELTLKITLCTTKYDSEIGQKQDTIKSAVDNFSKVPMLLENKQLKQNTEILNRQILVLNGRNNTLQSQLRQLHSDKYKLQLRIKQLNILQKMREQRFQDQVSRLTPIIIQEPSQHSTLTTTAKQLTKTILQTITQTLYNIFVLCTKQCARTNSKKNNSFTIFFGYFRELRDNRSYGFAAVLAVYRALRKVMKIVDQRFGEVRGSQGQDGEDGEEDGFVGSVDQWVVNSVVQVNAEVSKEEERKLYRLLALKYRCQFPIQGEKWEIREDVTQYLDDCIAMEAIRLIIGPPPAKKDDS